MSAASSRPCRDIQTLCQPSISTAKPRMAALNSSCPLPPNSCDKAPANSATMQAPSTPATTPPAIQRPRPATPDVTAMTMPTISPASKTSRNTIRSDGSTGTSHCSFGDSFYGQISLRLAVEVVEEIISTWLQRPHVNDRLAARRDDFLDMQRAAFKFRGDGAEV